MHRSPLRRQPCCLKIPFGQKQHGGYSLQVSTMVVQPVISHCVFVIITSTRILFFYVCVFNVILSNFFIHVWLYWGSWQVTIFFIGICFAWFHCFNSSPGYLFVLKSMPLFVGYLSSVFIFHLASVSDEKYGGLKK